MSNISSDNPLGKPEAPPAPDYAGAASAQGAANLQTAIANGKLSNPDIINPYGSQTVTYGVGGDPLHALVTQSLSPTGQQLFDKYQGINLGLGDLAQSGLGYVQNTLNTPFNTAALPAAPVNAGQSGQDALLSRIEPQIQQDREQLNTQLVNQGLNPGTEAWDNAWRQQTQRENDLRLQAAAQGINVGQQARQQGIQEQEFLRSEPLNMLNAVRSSAPVAVPQFQNYQGSQAAAAPIFNAAQAQGQYGLQDYGIQSGLYNNFTGGLFQLGAAGLRGGGK